jgi:uncharacterized protein YjbJ (UPF0337 family)
VPQRTDFALRKPDDALHGVTVASVPSHPGFTEHSVQPTNSPLSIRHIQGIHMNWEHIKGNWEQIKGAARQAWGDLTHDQFEVNAGRRERQSGIDQASYEYYGYTTEKQLAARQIARK